MAEPVRMYADKNVRYQRTVPFRGVSLAYTLLLTLPMLAISVASTLVALRLPDDFAKIIQHPWTQQLCRYIDCSLWQQPLPTYDDVLMHDVRLIQHGTTLIFSGYISYAAGAIDWPQAELILSNVKRQEVAQYRLQPRNYLSAAATPQMTGVKQKMYFSVDNLNQAAEYLVRFTTAKERWKTGAAGNRTG